MSCGVGCRCGSDPTLLWLCRRPTAIAPIRPLAWEPPYAAGEALERHQKKKKNYTTYIVSVQRSWEIQFESHLQLPHLTEENTEYAAAE